MFAFIKLEKYVDKVWKLQILSIVLFYISNIFYQYFTKVFCVNQILRYMIFFVLGFLCNEYYTKISEFMTLHYKLCVCSSLFLVIIIYMIDYKEGYLAGLVFSGNATLRILMASLELVKQISWIYLIVSFFRKMENKWCITKNKYIEFFSKRSFKIYLFHLPIVLVMLKYMPIFGTELVKSIFCSVIAILGSLLIILLLEMLQKLLQEIFKGKTIG